MEIKEVTVALGTTVNIGNYESTRVDVSICADMTQEEYDADGMDTLDKLVREEVVYRLWDYAEKDLTAANVAAWNADHLESRASRWSPYFAHMLKFAPHIATGLLTSLIEDAEEKKRAEAVVKAEANKHVDEPVGEEKHWLGQEVEDLEAPNQGFN